MIFNDMLLPKMVDGYRKIRLIQNFDVCGRLVVETQYDQNRWKSGIVTQRLNRLLRNIQGDFRADIGHMNQIHKGKRTMVDRDNQVQLPMEIIINTSVMESSQDTIENKGIQQKR